MSLPTYTKLTVAKVGDSVVFTDEEGYEFEGVVKNSDKDSLHINFVDGDEGWESRSACVVVVRGTEGGAEQ